MRATGPVPAVSVLLPAWEEAALLGACLDSLLRVTEPPLEIVVCAGGRDHTGEIARRYAAAHPGRIVVLDQAAGEGKQAALRRCLATARADLLYLTDADCVVPAATLRRLVAATAAGEAVVTGDSEPHPHLAARPLVDYQAYGDALGARRLGDYTVGLHGRNTLVTRRALEAAGAFGWEARTGTDYALAEQLGRAGYRVRYLADAPVFSDYPTDVPAYVRQRARWLRNLVLLGYRYRRPSLALPALVSGLALAALLPALPVGWLLGRRPARVVLLGWGVLAAKRGADAARARPRAPGGAGATGARVALAVAMTPVEVWIRARALVELLAPGWRWRW